MIAIAEEESTRRSIRPAPVQSNLLEIAPDVACLGQPIVNLFFFGPPNAPSGSWVLIDAGLPWGTKSILKAAAARYGPNSRPRAILLTHGHFDHVGALVELAELWQVPIYAHHFELPYITGRSSYPPGDPAVGGGGMAWMARLYPRGPVNAGPVVQELPEDNLVPGMPGWRWIHTPGHSPGHISLFRESDRLLIAGDAFVTTRQESLICALAQPQAIHGPPKYYTIDWALARQSVELLADLEPEIAATGHGKPMAGEWLRRELRMLARTFDEQAVPEYGRYVREPAVADDDGVIYTPPRVINPRHLAVGIMASVVGTAAMGYYFSRRNQRLRRSPLEARVGRG